MNADMKIITKALTIRIEKVISSLFHPDQTRRSFNLMVSIHHKNSAIITLNAEKAFDKVNLSFLSLILNTFRIGDSFINSIKLFYTWHGATVTTINITSKNFILQRGTRQGCPLYLSLFSIFTEPAIHQNSTIKGINLTEHEILFIRWWCSPISYIPQGCGSWVLSATHTEGQGLY